MVGEEEAEGLQMVMTHHQVGHPMNNPPTRMKEKGMMKVIPQPPVPDKGDLLPQPVPGKAHIEQKTPTEGQTKVMTGTNSHWDIENRGGPAKGQPVLQVWTGRTLLIPCISTSLARTPIPHTYTFPTGFLVQSCVEV